MTMDVRGTSCISFRMVAKDCIEDRRKLLVDEFAMKGENYEAVGGRKVDLIEWCSIHGVV